MKIIEINLLPPEYAPPPLYSFRNIAIFALSLLIASFLPLIALRMTNLKNEYDRKYKQLMRNIEMYGKQKLQINKLKEQEATLTQRRKMLMELIGQRFTWSDKLISLYNKIPEDLWLSSISLERQEIQILKTTGEEKKGNKASPARNKAVAQNSEEENVQQLILLHILGDALGLPQIGEFIARLDESPAFEGTKLLSIGQNERKGRPVMSFEITTLPLSTDF